MNETRIFDLSNLAPEELNDGFKGVVSAITYDKVKEHWVEKINSGIDFDTACSQMAAVWGDNWEDNMEKIWQEVDRDNVRAASQKLLSGVTDLLDALSDSYGCDFMTMTVNEILCTLEEADAHKVQLALAGGQ